MTQTPTRFPTLLIALLALAACARDAAPSWRGDLQLRGTVVEVEDGDTVTLRGLSERPARWRIRLSDIDTPETAHGQQRPGQAHGRAAGARLAELALGRAVTADCFEPDRYGRLVCHLHLPDGRLAHRLLLQAGLAWPAERPDWRRDPASDSLAAAARAAGRGLWADPQAMAPWIWRRQCWAAPHSSEACPNAKR